MISAPIPDNEPDRQAALEKYNILDTPREADYDEIVKLASDICHAPISLISLIDMQRQWFKANIGLDVDETSRDIAFCTHAILKNDIMIVEDAKTDDRFFDNPLVLSEPNIRFYAGMPLVNPDGYKLGTLCVIDTIPRELNDFQKDALRVLSKQVVNHLDRRLKVNELNKAVFVIQNQKDTLERLHNAQSRMLSIVGHDLRSPLSSLKSMLILFDDEILTPDETKEMAGKLAILVDSTTELLENLLFWARKQFDRQAPELAPVDMHEKANECINLLAFHATEKGNTLTNNIPAGYHVVGEGNILLFIIRNLLTNANKFTTNGTIAIGVSDTGQSTLINIADTGIGMPPEKLSRIFNWENTMSTYGTAGEKGSGLGLSMCQEFAHLLGGEITVSSEPGKGSVFSLVLPAAKQA